MATDPVTGRTLPEGFVLVSPIANLLRPIFGMPLRVDQQIVVAQDYLGRNLPFAISDRIVRAWRYPDTAPRTARLAYVAWRVSRYKGPGPSPKWPPE